jgi:hypothetical protein
MADHRIFRALKTEKRTGEAPGDDADLPYGCLQVHRRRALREALQAALHIILCMM